MIPAVAAVGATTDTTSDRTGRRGQLLHHVYVLISHTVYMNKGFEIMQINYFVFCGANIIKEFQVTVSSGVRSEGAGHGGFWPPDGGGPGRDSGSDSGLQEEEGGQGEGADQHNQCNKMAEVLLNRERDRQINKYYVQEYRFFCR